MSRNPAKEVKEIDECTARKSCAASERELGSGYAGSRPVGLDSLKLLRMIIDVSVFNPVTGDKRNMRFKKAHNRRQ